jgi:hypothetical protein
LLKLVEIALADRGARDNSAYLTSNKRQKLNRNEEMTEKQTREILVAVEDLVTDTFPETFTCHCGEELVKGEGKSTFSAALKAHLSTYCAWFNIWRQILLTLPAVDRTYVFRNLNLLIYLA